MRDQKTIAVTLAAHDVATKLNTRLRCSPIEKQSHRTQS
jgi:hypothetical protein